jgi:hypothetical protein
VNTDAMLPGSAVPAAQPPVQRHGFRVGGLCLVPAAGVLTELIVQAQAFPLPRSSATLVGLVNLRGSVVPVFDAHAPERPIAHIRPAPCTALVFGRDQERSALLCPEAPQLLDLMVPPVNPARPVSPLEPHLRRPWMRCDAPHDIWWEIDHLAAFGLLAQVARGPAAAPSIAPSTEASS